jgi:hypothetical protein
MIGDRSTTSQPGCVRGQVVLLATSMSLVCVGAHAGEPPPRQQGRAAIAAAATEGPRDLASLSLSIKAFVESRPYGKQWREIVPKAPEPRSRKGFGKADTVPELRHDQIEMQEQSEFRADTDFSVRYGLVSIRGQHIFRFGTLVAVQLVLERIGRDRRQNAKHQADLVALSKSWKDPVKALGLERTMIVAQSQLGQESRGPRVIELQPRLIRKR